MSYLFGSLEFVLHGLFGDLHLDDFLPERLVFILGPRALVLHRLQFVVQTHRYVFGHLCAREHVTRRTSRRHARNERTNKPSGPAPDRGEALHRRVRSEPRASSSARPCEGGTEGSGSSCWNGPVPCGVPGAGTPPLPGSCLESPPSPHATRPLHPKVMPIRIGIKNLNENHDHLCIRKIVHYANSIQNKNLFKQE